MNTLVYLINLAIGFLFLTFVWFPKIILPFFYGIPKSTYYCLKGVLFGAAVSRYFLTIALWTFVTIGFVIFLMFLPNKFVDWAALETASLIGGVFAVIFSITKKGRVTLNRDFWDANIGYRNNEDLFTYYASKAVAEYSICYPEEM